MSQQPDVVVNIHEAKTQLSRLLSKVASGQRVVIAKAGVPVADLVKHQPRSVSFGTLDLAYPEGAFTEELDEQVADMMGAR